ncbi:hypothetical protein [Sphingopyxis sp. SCN 67-31]|uniref:hypothetical protein n=1 Tax=Sphingopyxis sp. SCN 67-31 TaxID=1660142 RepID=UPI00086E03E4|nr:hypothetical protein [Sphingopyxis sp. SCN 67-31]ODU29002.1 MAG: hypothetical protein ABS88_10755 [Sphingopyxis sp. SCN 67-31]
MSTLSRATGTTRKRNPRDYYPTIDPRAVAPLVAHLGRGVRYAEPCAGAGDMVDLLAPHGWDCAWAADLLPMRRTVHSTGQLIAQQDVVTLPQMMAATRELGDVDIFATNPAWDRRLLHMKIDVLARLRPTWLLFDAAWKETKQAARFGKYCHTIISVGRLVWIEGSDAQSIDDCSWYGFDASREWKTEYVWPTANRDPVEQMVLAL